MQVCYCRSKTGEIVTSCINFTPMRTNIDINDDLLREAMELAKTKTKKETIERALHELIRDLKERGFCQ